ncbi:hypothetical protein BGZ54_004990 [Gamsiella multidivaricata]|nr:hypothetical protein BGZ54_004990 [Gamsiella multidivaricata]
MQHLIPLRISYVPGVVLDVIMKSAEEGASAPLETSSPSQGIVGHIPPVSEGSMVLVVELHRYTDLSIAAKGTAVKDTTTKVLAVQSVERTVITQQSLQEYFQHYQSYLKSNVSGQPIQAASIKDTMKERFGLLDTQLQSNYIFQVYTLQIQQQVLNQLALLQNYV